MNFLPTTKYKNNERTVSGTVNVENSDVLINVNTSLVPCTIYLKEIPPNYWSTLYKLYVKDITGNAAINNITIVAPIGYSINNQQQIIIDVNGGGAIIRIQDNIDYNASLNYCCAKDRSLNGYITQQPREAIYELICFVEGGVSPYTYEWSFAQYTPQGLTPQLPLSTTNIQVMEYIDFAYAMVALGNGEYRSCFMKCKITDSNGLFNYIYYNATLAFRRT
jgi:hypothetical protein